MSEGEPIKINCYGTDISEVSGTLNCGTDYSLKHIDGDPSSVYRFYLTGENFSLEITPSRGLSVRDFLCRGKQIFWNPPLDNLPDPAAINLEKSIIIDGKEVKGAGWLEYFASHIEMLGLDNWGTPVEKDGKITGLHGNASSIPVTEILLEEKEEQIVVSGSFNIYDPNKLFPDNQDAVPYFRVEKSLEFYINKPLLLIKDRIVNTGKQPRFPDWGYHVQLKPEHGYRYLVPSKEVKKRGNGYPEKDFEYWKEAKNTHIREERGFIHKDLLLSDGAFPDGSRGVVTLLQYNNGIGVKCVLPPSPYILSWFSCGGKGSSEFIAPGNNSRRDRKLLNRNWDGVGPEFGSSALDHDGDTDPAFTQSLLEPGQSREVQFYLELLEPVSAEELLSQIEDFNSKRDLIG